MAHFTIDDFRKISLCALTRRQVQTLMYAVGYADEHDDEGIRSSDPEAVERTKDIEVILDVIGRALKEEALRPAPKAVVIEHDDGHNEPMTTQFDSLQEAAKFIWQRDGGFGSTVDDVLQALHDEEEYHGVDTWTILHDY